MGDAHLHAPCVTDGEERLATIVGSDVGRTHRVQRSYWYDWGLGAVLDYGRRVSTLYFRSPRNRRWTPMGMQFAETFRASGAVHTAILYRPVGPAELALVAASGWREFPPRLPSQPIFYPVLNEDYARHIAGRWNVADSGAGFVLRFAVEAEFARRYPVRVAGASWHQELWVPAEELPEFNRRIVGPIELIAEFRR